MNPGGLRQTWSAASPATVYPQTLTYKQAADVQPFANTLVNMDLTGAQIKATLEQQWQPAGAVSSVPAARYVGGLHVHLRPGQAAGSRITDMWLDGTPIDLAYDLLGHGELVPRGGR